MAQDADRPNPAIRAFRAVSGGLSRLAGLGIVLLILPTAVDVGWRYLSGSSVPGMIEYSEVAIVFVVYFGIAQAMRDDAHIATPVFTSRLSPRLADRVRLAGRVLLFALVAFATWRTGVAALSAHATGEYRLGLVSIPTWPARAAVTLGFALMLVAIGIDINARLRRLKR
jgi:TRAP-type C4-dicarboxylate transport system permease small subunit